ncbi:MAG: cytochrome P450 [Thermoleophilaceae bacterium]
MQEAVGRETAASGVAGAIPGPPGHPLTGMAGRMRTDLLGTLWESFVRYGDVVAYRVGPACGPRWLRRQTVAAHHPDDVRRVLTDTDAFTRDTTSYRVLRELFGSNLVTVDGDAWRRQRRILQPLFTPANVRRYAAVIEAEAERAIEAQRLGAGGVIDAVHTMEAYALRVLGRTLFEDERGIDDETVAALERLVPVVGGLVRSRATQFVRLPLALPSARNRRFVETRTRLYATIDRVLARRAEHELEGGEDLLGRLRDARDPHDGMPLDDREIRDQALIFLISGHTTTSNALTSTLYLLGRNPAAQDDVAAAVDERDTRRDLVRAAVQEGMRLQPPAYVIARRVRGAAELGRYSVPDGTTVLVSPWVTHRHPGFWDDPDSFDPRRFVDGREPDRWAYIPFGGGARACIGRHFAQLEATVLVRALLRRYRLESLDADVPHAQLISLRPDGPVEVRCTPR